MRAAWKTTPHPGFLPTYLWCDGTTKSSRQLNSTESSVGVPTGLISRNGNSRAAVYQRNSSRQEELCETAMAVIDAGWGTTDDVRRASAWRVSHRPQLGKLALTTGSLTVQQVFEVLRHQASIGGLFGEIAVELGLLERGTLYELLEQQARLTPTLSDALLNLAIITPDQALALSATPQLAG